MGVFNLVGGAGCLVQACRGKERMADDREFTCFAVGLMSGTSMDGIDACVLEITESAEDTGKELKCVDDLLSIS